MAEALDLYGQIRQNLKDAACPDDTTDLFLNLLATGKNKEGLRLLRRHREHLLGVVHENYRYIDCLDYLLYKLKL